MAGVIALFLVLTGGAAYASNTVFSTDIVDGEVKTADISDSDGVRSADARDVRLSGGGLAAVDLRSDSVGTSEVAANSLGGADTKEGTLGGLDAKDDFDFVCDPESTEYLDRDAPAMITLERAMNVPVIATSHFQRLRRQSGVGQLPPSKRKVSWTRPSTRSAATPRAPIRAE